MVVIGWWGLSLPPRTCFQGRISLFVYVHARNNCLHISVRAAIGIFECEAHFKQDNSTSQCVCVCRGYEVMEGFTCFTVRRGFCWWGGGWWLFEVRVVSPWAVCSLNAGQSPVWSSVWMEGDGGLVVLFDDLRTVAPGFGLSLGQGQPGRLCGYLRRVTGGEALWHLLDSRWRRCRVCDLNWNNKSWRQLDYFNEIS